MNRNIILAAVALVAVAIGGYFFMGQQAPSAGVELGAAQAQTASDVDTSGVREMYIGDANAPVTVVEYASFTCPHCKTFHENIVPQLKADFVDTGKVKFVFREVYFDRYGLWAGMVARCGGGNRYFGIVDLIFENQRSWSQGEPAQVAGNLKKMGKLAGMDDATLDACLQDGDKAKALTAVFQETSQADGIRATPTLVINGKLQENAPYAEIKAAIEAAL